MTLFSFQPTDPAKFGAFNFVVTNIPKLDDNAYHGLEIYGGQAAFAQVASAHWIYGPASEGRLRTGLFGPGNQRQFHDPNNDINRNNNYLNLDATYVFQSRQHLRTAVENRNPALTSNITLVSRCSRRTPCRSRWEYAHAPISLTSRSSCNRRASWRLPSVNMLNLRLSREIVLGERWHIIPTVDFST